MGYRPFGGPRLPEADLAGAALLDYGPALRGIIKSAQIGFLKLTVLDNDDAAKKGYPDSRNLARYLVMATTASSRAGEQR
jgi:hypothetical protein